MKYQTLEELGSLGDLELARLGGKSKYQMYAVNLEAQRRAALQRVEHQIEVLQALAGVLQAPDRLNRSRLEEIDQITDFGVYVRMKRILTTIAAWHDIPTPEDEYRYMSFDELLELAEVMGNTYEMGEDQVPGELPDDGEAWDYPELKRPRLPKARKPTFTLSAFDSKKAVEEVLKIRKNVGVRLDPKTIDQHSLFRSYFERRGTQEGQLLLRGAGLHDDMLHCMALTPEEMAQHYTKLQPLLGEQVSSLANGLFELQMYATLTRWWWGRGEGPLPSRMGEQYEQIAVSLAVADDDLISKPARDGLEIIGLVKRQEDGCTILTDVGDAIWNLWNEDPTRENTPEG